MNIIIRLIFRTGRNCVWITLFFDMSIVNFLDKFRTDTSLKNMIFPLTSVEIIRNNRRIIFVDYNIKEGASAIVKSRFGSCAKSVNIDRFSWKSSLDMAVIHFAPLQGYTDSVYREAHTRVFGGVDTYYTPFVRIEKGGFRNKDLKDIACDRNRQVHVVPQLIASTPDEFRPIVRLFQENGYKEADINLGCPFPMQVRAHRGSGLLRYKEEAESLLRTIEEFPDISFSVKMRLGWECTDESFVLLSLLNKLPLKHITLHPRLGIQQYKGAIDWDGFSRFYDECELPLYYNGDLVGLEDIRGIKERFPGLAGIMLGRGLLASPWLATEFVSGQVLTVNERRDKLVMFHESLMDEYAARLEGGEHQVLSKMKTIWDYLLPEADKRLRKKVLKSTSLTSYQSAVKDLLSL